MKFLKRILVWSLTAIVLQAAVYFYFDKFYLGVASTFNETKIDTPNSTSKQLPDVTIPDGAENLKISYNGKFASYEDGGTLKVMNMDTKKTTSVSMDSGSQLSYYNWLPDRNRLIICEKSTKTSSIRFTSYDSDKDEKTKLTDNNSKEVVLSGISHDMNITDIEMSTLTNTMYLKLSNKQGTSSVYCINVMNAISRVSSDTSKIGSIGITREDTRLIYENGASNSVIVAGAKGKKLVAPGSNYTVLLGTDNNNNIYLGTVVNNEVSKIHYGNINDSVGAWKALALSKPTGKSNIYVSKDGQVFVNDKTQHSFTSITSNTSVNYEGIIVKLYTNGITTLNGRTLKHYNFK